MPQPSDEGPSLHASPVYLAGPAASTPALRPLLDAGFRREADAKGNVHLTSLGGHQHVDYMPNGLTHALWQISGQSPDRYTPPTWQATFTTGTPPEVVAAITTALTQKASPWPGGRRPRADDVLRPLADAGWRRRENEWEIEFTSPDRLATVLCDTTPGHPLDPEYEPWLISGGRTLGYGYEWYAAFTTHTPPHLVTVTAARLADPAPVPRTDTAVLHAEATLHEAAGRSTTPANSPRASAALRRTSTTAPARGTGSQPSPEPIQAAASRPGLRR
ncbi:DUF317 domain-containing protein [Streptomyces smyrnaeus]|uniref:DUF317 domain-containing protein n=1 Tax=Streptomyces smyrnaeus TaxID=1387713 RepID=UPI0036BECA88